jgi:hypothetical protein
MTTLEGKHTNTQKNFRSKTNYYSGKLIYFTYVAAVMKNYTITKQRGFIIKWKISFRKFIVIRRMLEDSL